MKHFRSLLTVVGLVGSGIAHAAEPLPANAQCASLPLLQGTWEGFMVGDKLEKKITVTLNDRSLHFYRDRNFWFEANVILPADKDPRQLQATITGRSPSQPVDPGRVVRAVFKLEEEILTLATIGDDPAETPKSFESLATRYEFRKVRSDAKYTQPPKPETNDFKFEARPKQPGKYSQPPKPETDRFRFEARPERAGTSEK